MDGSMANLKLIIKFHKLAPGPSLVEWVEKAEFVRRIYGIKQLKHIISLGLTAGDIYWKQSELTSVVHVLPLIFDCDYGQCHFHLLPTSERLGHFTPCFPLPVDGLCLLYLFYYVQVRNWFIQLAIYPFSVDAKMARNRVYVFFPLQRTHVTYGHFNQWSKLILSLLCEQDWESWWRVTSPFLNIQFFRVIMHDSHRGNLPVKKTTKKYALWNKIWRFFSHPILMISSFSVFDIIKCYLWENGILIDLSSLN